MQINRALKQFSQTIDEHCFYENNSCNPPCCDGV